jgi:uncharacterized protein
MAGKVVHFEIPLDDAERGRAFYEQALGWQLEQWGPVPYWTLAGAEGEGIGGGLTMRSDEVPGPLFYVGCDDVDATLTTVEAAGGTTLMGRSPIPGMGWMALFQDTEGNRVGLFQLDPEAPMPEDGMDADWSPEGTE